MNSIQCVEIFSPSITGSIVISPLNVPRKSKPLGEQNLQVHSWFTNLLIWCDMLYRQPLLFEIFFVFLPYFCFFFLFFVIFFTRLRLRINEHIINLLQQRNTGQWLFIYSPMASRENMEAAWREHALWSDVFWRDIELVWRSTFLPVLSLFCRLCPKKYHSKCPCLTTKLKSLILWKDTLAVYYATERFAKIANSLMSVSQTVSLHWISPDCYTKILRQWNPHLSWNFIAV